MNPFIDKSAIEAFPFAVFIKNANGHYLEVNQKFCDLIGIPADRIIGQTAGDLFTAEVTVKIEGEDLTVVTQKKSMSFSRIIQVKATEIRYINVTKSPILDDTGAIIAIMGTGEEVNDSSSESTNVHDLTIWREDIDRFFTTALDMLCILDLKGVPIRMSPKWSTVSGWSVDELMSHDLQGHIHPDDLEETLAAFKKLVAGMPVHGLVNRFRNKDDSYIWLQWNALAIPERGRVIAAAHDITELKNVENLLKSTNEAAVRANEAKSAFIANMSHEFRTPLNAILGFGDLIKSTDLTEQQLRYIQSIRKAANVLLDLINDILDISKMDVGLVTVSNTGMCLSGLMDDIMQVFSYKTLEKGLKMHLDMPSDFPLNIALDATRIRQILLNIIGNAVKFTASGSISIKVSMMNTIGRRFNLLFDITDTGIGIPPEEQELIFEAFMQQSAPIQRQFSGTGLGLSISKKLVEMMEGTLSVSSEVGKGSTFHISIPDVEILSTGFKQDNEVIPYYDSMMQDALDAIDTFDLNGPSLNRAEWVLPESFIPILNRLKGAIKITDALALSESLIAYGKEHQEQNLIWIGRALFESASQYDIKRLIDLINRLWEAQNQPR